MREKLTLKKETRDPIRWRSHEPSRLETFSDAVFAFALTLIVVSVEVPKTFDDLAEMLKGTISFAFCFLVLFMIWNNQNIFFRRYGLKDGYTVTLNGILLFVSLIYVYPLKFLTTLFVSDQYLYHGHWIDRIKQEQGPYLMIIYSTGYSVIYLLFFLMYKNAERRAVLLELSPKELYETKTASFINLFNIIIGLLVIIAVVVLPTNLAGACGYIYFLIAPTYTFWYAYRGKRSRLKFGN